jgi:hypothetical protein
VVWFNQGLSQNYDAVRLIRAEAAGALVVCASHRERDAPVLQVADRGFEEPPRATPEEAYVQWALEICVREQVDLFVPSRHAGAIAAARAQFERRGVRVQVAQAEALAGALEYKDTLYAEVAGQLELPAYRVVSSLAQFDEAYAALRLDHQRLCVKPTRGLFGAGFRILDETIDPLDAILRVEGTLAALAVYRSALAQTRRAFSLMLMEYLEGPERSVDCLAHQGELVTAVARLKHGRHQSLETSGAAIEGARRLVERYRLDGIVNIQFRDTRGIPHLLEINARMAGGMLYSCAALNLPYWSAMLALGLAQPHDVPAPRQGLRVAPISGALIIPNDAS